MKVFGLMVTKNEVDRYLEASVLNNKSAVDELFVYDDQSSDLTPLVAGNNWAKVKIRSTFIPPFLDHEGQFRNASLRALENALEPEEGDWIFVIDADEFIVSDNPFVENEIKYQCELANRSGAKSIRLPRPEVWQIDGSTHRVRVDGLWGGMTCTRLFRWEAGGQIPNKAMGCGNEPTYINLAPTMPVNDIYIMHYGYVNQVDLEEKYNRYTTLLDHGHIDSHIQSIKQESPQLEDWTGPIPEIWRGLRDSERYTNYIQRG